MIRFVHGLLGLFLFLASGGLLVAQSDLSFEGSHYWSISNNVCRFTGGNIVNNSSSGSTSGTIRLSLIASAQVFPAAGYRIASETFNPLRGGYQYTNYRVTTEASIPKITGYYYFTMVLEQYTASGWKTSAYLNRNGPQYLKSGIFSNPPPWKPPGGAVKKPRPKMKPGMTIHLVHQGGESNQGYISYIPKGSQLKLSVLLGTSGNGTMYGGTREATPLYWSYGTGKTRYLGKKYSVGRLMLDFGGPLGVVSYGDHSLFFQTAKRGFYKSHDVTTSVGHDGYSWGVFRIE